MFIKQCTLLARPCLSVNLIHVGSGCFCCKERGDEGGGVDVGGAMGEGGLKFEGSKLRSSSHHCFSGPG